MPSEKSKDKIPVSLIRRNIMLQRYEKYQDKTIQHELFDKIFCDQKQRLNLEKLIEVVSIFLVEKKEE